MEEGIITFLVIGLTLIGYFVGQYVREKTHIIIPFKEPVSMFLLFLTLLPTIMSIYFPDIAFVDPGAISTISVYAGFWSGYVIGYVKTQVDLKYVAVHKIVELEQSIEPIVCYENKEGQMCWQPQSFWGSIRTVIFNVHNPLILTGDIYRTRHVTLKKVFFQLEADTVDLSGLEIINSEVKKWIFTFKVTTKKYIPSPNATDLPEVFYARAEGLEEMKKANLRLAMANTSNMAKMESLTVETATDLLNTLVSDNPSKIFMDNFADKMRGEEQAKEDRRTQREIAKVRNVHDGVVADGTEVEG